MVTLESKLSEARSKKDLYIARARSAKASQQMNEMLGRVGTSKAMTAFERMEERVLQLEAQSEAMAELGTDDLEKRFTALESGGAVDAQLAAMKAEMLGGTSAAANLPPSQPETRTSTGNSVDQELEQLRQLRDR